MPIPDTTICDDRAPVARLRRHSAAQPAGGADFAMFLVPLRCLPAGTATPNKPTGKSRLKRARQRTWRARLVTMLC